MSLQKYFYQDQVVVNFLLIINNIHFSHEKYIKKLLVRLPHKHQPSVELQPYCYELSNALQKVLAKHLMGWSFHLLVWDL